MGTVFLAVSEGAYGFSKLKVVKHLRGDLALEASFLRSFLDEARLSARLMHPNVVQTNEVGFDGQHYFIEMEHLDGQTLEALGRKLGAAEPPRRLPLPLALHLVSEILAGLDYAHELEDVDGTKLHVVHRDVSPHNVFVTYDGRVKLLDFGIAKAKGAASDTATGVVKGKLTYMAPEQAMRLSVDRRADVFSVGVILWQFLTGRRLWLDTPESQIYLKLERGEIDPPSSIAPDVRPTLEAICMKALAASPDARYATAAEMQEALEPELDAKSGAKELARQMESLFAVERAATRGQIDTSLKAPKDHGPAGPPVLAPSAAEGGATQSRASVTRTVRPDAELDAAERPAWGGRRLRGLVAGALVVSAVVAGGAVVARRAGPVAVAPSVPRGCTTNRACVEDAGGKPAVCRHDDGVCVALETPRCKVMADPGAAENDATLWIGTMFPMSGSDAVAWGTESVNAAELARRDFMTIARGIPSAVPGKEPRPIGLVACDDEGDALATARHLVDVRVPAVVGFGSSQEVIDLAGAVFIPAGVVAMATQNQSALITTIPHPPGLPRMVWRTTVSAPQVAAPVSAIVAEILEPQLRASLRPTEPLRVVLLRAKNTAGLSISDEYFGVLRFNGKSALENGQSYRELVWNEDDAEFAEIATEILAFKPHVILLPGVQGTATALLAPIEAGWQKGQPRPHYVVSNYIVGDDFFVFVGKDAELRRRFVGVAPATATVANAKLTLHYNETFSPKVPRTATPGAVYDAVYLVAYGVYALGDAPVTGTALAHAFERLLPPGLALDVGPAKIFDVFASLRAGQRVDLGGAATRLDFDPATGNTPADFTVLCVGAADRGGLGEAVESSVVFSASTRHLEGLPLRCP
jgi:hypothetical protein